MPRRKSPTAIQERSAPRPPQLSLAAAIPGSPASGPSLRPLQSTYPPPVGPLSAPSQPTYSETILQRPTLAIDPSALPPQLSPAGPLSATSRRRSSSSMRNASMTFENIAPSQTPTGRISKAKKGKRVHACEFPGCGKVFTRAEHRRRHELNHNPEAIYRCPQPGCGKSFHRMDLLQRHQERHDSEASPSLPQATPRHPSNVFTSPPSVLPASTLSATSPESAARTSSVSIPSLVHPPHSQYSIGDSSLNFNSGVYMAPYAQAVDPYFYGSEGSQSPASDHIGRYHRPSISSASSVVGFDSSAISPTMTSSIPGTWVPATAAPPLVLPSNVFEEGQATYMQSTTVNSMPVHLRELDGHEFATIQRELSNVPELIFDSSRPELPKYIRSDCLEHYWKYFHPTFPIVYKPNFVTNTPPPLLLSAVLAIGSFYDSRPDARHYSLALQEIATKLLRQRGEKITGASRIADLQTVLLLEILSKYSARHAAPETSARFRALFASLHQTRQILIQNPLAVFKTLKQERSDKDIKRAHEFWLQHEARRRIFHACTILDAQQVALFEQRPTILTYSTLGAGLPDSKGSVDLPCDDELWEASTLSEWAAKAVFVVPQDVNAARLNYQSASMSDYSFFQHQIISVQSTIGQRCLEELSSPQKVEGSPSTTKFSYHVYQMAKNMPIRALLIVAGESWFLGKKIEQESEFVQARTKVRKWVTDTTGSTELQHIPDAWQALWHALQLLRMLVAPVGNSQSFLTTNMLHEDWTVYLAALVCWAHGYSNSQPTKATELATTPKASTANLRKRKNTADTSTLSGKRRTAQGSTLGNAAGTITFSSATHTTQAPHATPVSAYTDTSWSAYGPATHCGGQWAAYYDQSMLAYAHQAEASASNASATATTGEPSAYGSAARTATNTPLSQVSFATAATSAPFSVSSKDDSMSELRTYLSLTDVAAPQQLLALESSILTRTKGVLDAIRIHKIGAKRSVGGLMNDAERILSRLAEGRNNDMF